MKTLMVGCEVKSRELRSKPCKWVAKRCGLARQKPRRNCGTSMVRRERRCNGRPSGLWRMDMLLPMRTRLWRPYDGASKVCDRRGAGDRGCGVCTRLGEI